TAGARVLLLGAGGAARAALAALEEEGGAAVTVLARTPARAQGLKDRPGAEALAIRVVADAADVRGEDFDLVVNATPLGLRPGDPLPLDLSTHGVGSGPYVMSSTAPAVPRVERYGP